MQTIKLRTIALLTFILFIQVLIAKEVKIVILHTNDTHSRIEPLPKESGNRNAGLGGILRREALFNQYRQKEENLLIFDSGDFSQGTPYYNLYKGEVEVKFMSKLGYDAVTIGNHEFDYGLENMARLFQEANFSVVCANYDFSKTLLKDLVTPYVVLERGGVKIGVFGLGAALEGLVQAKNYVGVDYLDPIKTANRVVKQLKEQEKCDLVICLSHLGLYASSKYPVSDEVLARETKDIDLILGGHSHTFMKEPKVYLNSEGGNVIISQTGKSGFYVGKIELYLEK